MGTQAVQRGNVGVGVKIAGKPAIDATTSKVQVQAMAAKNQLAAGHSAMMNGVLGPMKISSPAGTALIRGNVLINAGSGAYNAYNQWDKSLQINDVRGMDRSEQDLHVSVALGLGAAAAVPSDLQAMGILSPKSVMGTEAIGGAKVFSLGLLGSGLLKKSYDERQRASKVSQFVEEVEGVIIFEELNGKAQISDLDELLNVIEEEGTRDAQKVHVEHLKRMVGADVLTKLEDQGHITTNAETGEIIVNNPKEAKELLLEGAKKVRTKHKVASVVTGLFGVGLTGIFAIAFLGLIGFPITGLPLAVIGTIGSVLIGLSSTGGFALQAKALYEAGLYRELALLTLVTVSATILMISGLEIAAVGVEMLYLIGLILYKTDALAVNLHSKEFTDSFASSIEAKEKAADEERVKRILNDALLEGDAMPSSPISTVSSGFETDDETASEASSAFTEDSDDDMEVGLLRSPSYYRLVDVPL